MTTLKFAAAGTLALGLFAACASPGGGPGEIEIRTGEIQQNT